MPELRAWNAEVIGVSSDSFDRQCAFARELELSFPLIADPEGSFAARYEARRFLLGANRRITYVIDPEGRIAAAFHHELHIPRHDAEVKAFFSQRLGARP